MHRIAESLSCIPETNVTVYVNDPSGSSPQVQSASLWLLPIWVREAGLQGLLDGLSPSWIAGEGGNPPQVSEDSSATQQASCAADNATHTHQGSFDFSQEGGMLHQNRPS